LHPQFEVLDWRGVSYFCNFAFITSHLKLIIEIKGLDTYASGMDRQTFCNELNRETFLSAMGYQVISFAYEDVANRPEICIMLLRIVISRYHAATSSVGVTTGYGA
jgi:very-short-patch-repair endonuclease